MPTTHEAFEAFLSHHGLEVVNTATGVYLIGDGGETWITDRHPSLISKGHVAITAHRIGSQHPLGPDSFHAGVYALRNALITGHDRTNQENTTMPTNFPTLDQAAVRAAALLDGYPDFDDEYDCGLMDAISVIYDVSVQEVADRIIVVSAAAAAACDHETADGDTLEAKLDVIKDKLEAVQAQLDEMRAQL